MSDQPDVQEIKRAVKASGYLMEQEIATLLEKEGYEIKISWAFTDQDLNKSREIDVLARNLVLRDSENEVEIVTELICECKNTTQPFVFIRRRKSSQDLRHVPEEILLNVRSYDLPRETDSAMVQVPAFFYLGLENYHQYYTQDLTAVQFCRVLRKKKGWEASHAGSYDSIFYPLVKAVDARKHQLRPPGIQFDKWSRIFLFYPIVVLNGPIYHIDTLVDEPEPIPTDHVTFVREVDSAAISGRYIVDFVTRQGLVKFVRDDIRSLAVHMRTLFQENPNLVHSSQPQESFESWKNRREQEKA